MLSRLISCVAVLMVVTGLGAVAAPSSVALPAPTAARALVAAPVNPHSGTYRGEDRLGRTISFTYAPHIGQVLHFTAGGLRRDRFGHVVEHADVSDGRAGPVCSSGGTAATHACFRLHWTSDTEVTGTWGQHRMSLPFTASLAAPPNPVPGLYNGTGLYGVEYLDQWIAFHASGETLSVGHWGWRRSGTEVEGPMVVTGSHHHFSGCGPDYCVQGHWQTNKLAVGSWRRNREDAPWIGWEATLDGRPDD